MGFPARAILLVGTILVEPRTWDPPKVAMCVEDWHWMSFLDVEKGRMDGWMI